MGQSRGDMEAVRLRLDCVERELSMLRRQRVGLLCSVAAGLLFLGAVHGAKTPERVSAKQVETQELVIRDSNGVLRAALVTSESIKGGPHAKSATGPATSLSLFDANGDARIRLLVDAAGTPSLVVSGTDRSAVELSADPSPVINLFQPTHQLRLYATPKGTAGLVISGPQSGDRIALKTHADSGSSFEMRRQNQLVMYLGDSERAAPGSTGPRLRLFDSAGKLVHEAP
jgi:hypothetical protein